MARTPWTYIAVAAFAIGCGTTEPPEDAPPTRAAARPDLPAVDTSPVEVGPVFHVKFETSIGNFTIEVHPEWSPRGAAHFKKLVEDRFYDECRFFRVVPDFMVQFGISGDLEANAKWSDGILDDPIVGQSNQRSYVTFAQTALPNSRTTQLFINYADNSRLDGDNFTPFGKVVDGMDVVDKIDSRYGEEPSKDQAKIQAQGNLWLDLRYPGLDYIKTARIVSDEAEDGGSESTESAKAEASGGGESTDTMDSESDDSQTSDENQSD